MSGGTEGRTQYFGSMCQTTQPLSHSGAKIENCENMIVSAMDLSHIFVLTFRASRVARV